MAPLLTGHKSKVESWKESLTSLRVPFMGTRAPWLLQIAGQRHASREQSAKIEVKPIEVASSAIKGPNSCTNVWPRAGLHEIAFDRRREPRAPAMGASTIAICVRLSNTTESRMVNLSAPLLMFLL
jgi:hypothetical protein